MRLFKGAFLYGRALIKRPTIGTPVNTATIRRKDARLSGLISAERSGLPLLSLSLSLSLSVFFSPCAEKRQGYVELKRLYRATRNVGSARARARVLTRDRNAKVLISWEIENVSSLN